MKRIVHIGAFDTGGAGLAALRLCRGLRRSGLDSTMLVAEQRGFDACVTGVAPHVEPGRPEPRSALARVRPRLMRYLRTRPAGLEFFSDDRSEHGPAVLAQIPECEIIHLHWVARLVDLQRCLPAMSRRAPLVWTLHDMNAFTGGCHYSGDCFRFTDRCHACPQLGSADEFDPSLAIWHRKQRAFRGVDPKRLVFVTPSRWLADEARRSSLLSPFRVEVIPNGVDLDVYSPRDRRAARKQLDLPQDAVIVLFVAEYTDARRKGFAQLISALRAVRYDGNLQLVSIGALQRSEATQYPHRHLGPVHDELKLAALYAAADLFVIPSLEDNLPNTILESLASGTPVVGFDVGGIPDFVRPGATGELAPPGDVPALGAAIESLLANPDRLRGMRDTCRRTAETELSLDRCAAAYAALYDELLRPR